MLSNLLRRSSEANSWLIVQPDECSLRFFLLLEHFIVFWLHIGWLLGYIQRIDNSGWTWKYAERGMLCVCVSIQAALKLL